MGNQAGVLAGRQKTPTKLPAEIIRKILAYSSEEGDVVMDPFLGSGQVAVVSKAEGRHYVGFEIVPDYYEFALERINSGKYRIRATSDVKTEGNLTLWQ